MGSDPSMEAPMTMPWEERGIVVDREGTDLIGGRVVISRGHLIQRFTIQEVT